MTNFTESSEVQSGYLPRDPSWCRGHGPPPVPQRVRGSVLRRSAACTRRPWRPPTSRKERRRRPRPAACPSRNYPRCRRFRLVADAGQAPSSPASRGWTGREGGAAAGGSAPLSVTGEDLAGERRSLATSSLCRARSFSQLAGKSGPPERPPPPPRPDLLAALSRLSPSRPRTPE